MDAPRRADAWLTAAVYGMIWLLLAVVSLAAPWFVVFAFIFWIAAPALVLITAGSIALVPALRAGAFAVARGMAAAFVLSVVPSGLVVWGAVSQMGDNYF